MPVMLVQKVVLDYIPHQSLHATQTYKQLSHINV